MVHRYRRGIPDQGKVMRARKAAPHGQALLIALAVLLAGVLWIMVLSK
jgi:hypothetical protein